MKKIFLLLTTFLLLSLVALFFLNHENEFTYKDFTYKDFDTETIIYFPKCDKKIVAKIADETLEQQIGFSKVKSIEDKEGILFLFDTEEKRNFWMKDVNFDLDIIFLDKNQKVLEIFSMQKCLEERCKIYSTTYPIKYAIEIKKDVLKNCINIGDKIEINYTKLIEK